MDGEVISGFENNSTPDYSRDDQETVILPCSAGLPSAVETTLAQYADSIERLSADLVPPPHSYTRGFIAGLRAATKVSANAGRL